MNKTKFYRGQDNLIKNMYVAMLALSVLVFIWAVWLSISLVAIQRNNLFVSKARLVNETCGVLGGTIESELKGSQLTFSVVCGNEIDVILNGKVILEDG